VNAFTVSALEGFIRSSPLVALGVAAGMGPLTSIGPCTFLRAATLFGLVGERPTRRQGLWAASSFVLGLIVAYVILGMLITFVTGFTDASRVVYPLAGADSSPANGTDSTWAPVPSPAPEHDVRPTRAAPKEGCAAGFNIPKLELR
jgi:hypothetical protein